MTVDPPDDAAWWDTQPTADGVRRQLRLQSGDIDDERLQMLIPTAGRMINAWLDCVDAPPGPPPDPRLQWAIERQVIAMYPQRDSATSLEFPTVGLDPEVRAILAPLKQRVGIG